jgi:hypothetical protein
MRQLLLGATAMGSFVAGLFFLRFYRQTKDTLFAYFGAAFWILAAQAVALGLTNPDAEVRVYLYLPRLLAFVLIIVAIVQKNRAPS